MSEFVVTIMERKLVQRDDGTEKMRWTVYTRTTCPTCRRAVEEAFANLTKNEGFSVTIRLKR